MGCAWRRIPIATASGVSAARRRRTAAMTSAHRCARRTPPAAFVSIRVCSLRRALRVTWSASRSARRWALLRLGILIAFGYVKWGHQRVMKWLNLRDANVNVMQDNPLHEGMGANGENALFEEGSA